MIRPPRRAVTALAAALSLGAAGVAGIASPAAASPAAASPAAASPAAASPVRANAWQCRTATTHPSENLTSTATVCARYRRGSWEGSGTVRLVATGRTVTATITQGVEHVPASESRLVTRPVTVRPGSAVLVKLAGSEKAARRESAAGYVAMVGISRDGAAGELPTGPDGVSQVLEGRVYSPVVRRTSRLTRSSHFRGQGANSCVSRAVKDGGVQKFTGTAGLCLAQHDGTLTADVPRLRYSATGQTPVVLSVVVDGRTVTSTLLDLAPSPRAVTDVSLPSIDVQVLRGERSALLRLEVGGTTVSSKAVRLRS